jgi:hypothetical protein
MSSHRACDSHARHQAAFENLRSRQQQDGRSLSSLSPKMKVLLMSKYDATYIGTRSRKIVRALVPAQKMGWLGVSYAQ